MAAESGSAAEYTNRVQAPQPVRRADAILERTIEVEGTEIFYRLVEGEGDPTVFVHGNPTHSEDWLPFLERIGGAAIAPDLPGWGRSARPLDFDYSMHGLAAFLERLLDELGIERRSLVVHDWGGLALIGAQRRPERLARLVVIDSVPLLSGYRWHRVARIWRRRGAGELFAALTTRRGAALLLRHARPGYLPMPAAFLDALWRHYDRGTRRAMLELYRSAPSEALEAAGSRLGLIGCPALVVWGARDPYLPIELGREYSRRLRGAELVELVDAGHWPWIDRPDVIEEVTAFLAPG